MKKEKRSPHDKKVAQVMHKVAAGDLHAGKTETTVTNPKQAIANALSVAEGLDKQSK